MSKLWFIVFLFLIIGCLIGIGLLSGYFGARERNAYINDYAIVFDAGSSGTRMYLYKWKAGFRAVDGDPLVITELDACITSDNGIDKMNSQDELQQSFLYCMNRANQLIPDDRKNRTYITLAATAGMRLLEIENSSAANAILNYIRDYFSNSKYMFKNSSQVEIISGIDEGTNAWISVNYFLNNFKPNSEIYETNGILDLGGASTQIVYVPKSANSSFTQYFDKIKIYGANYEPYSMSHFCRGINQMRNLYHALLIIQANYTKLIQASCYPRNYSLTVKASTIINSPCTNGKIFVNQKLFVVNSSLLNQADVFTLVGTGDSFKCSNEIKLLLPKTECNYSNCSFDNVYQPPIENQKFYAISNYYFSFNATASILSNNNVFNSLDEFTNATKLICSKSYDELLYLNSLSESGIRTSSLMSLCIINLYELQLFNSFGFKDLNNVKVVDKINDFTVGWTLGYLITNLNRDDFLPYEIASRKTPIEYFIPLVALLSILAIISTILFFILGCGLRCYYKY